MNAAASEPTAAQAEADPGWSAGRVAVRALLVVLASLALCWPALINGQPFFHPDTVGYVRGADVALMKLLGPRFATDWGLESVGATAPPAAAPAGQAARSYNDQEVIGGRSIYYGALVSLGERTGGFWLTALIQGLAVALLIEILTRAAGLASPGAYAGVAALVALGASAPLFASLLMPDIWAGAAIAAIAGLFAFASRLRAPDVAALASIAAFAAMAHSSVPPVIGGLLAAGFVLWVLRRFAAPSPWIGVGASVLALAAAVAGAAAFSLAVSRTAGRPPVMPPFLTARLVADGTGARYVREHCAGQPFVVCRFADRLPLDVDHFLWGETPRDGVFLPASPAERRALGDEQTRFALAVVRAYPLQQAAVSLKNAALQTVTTELSDFDYKPSLRASLSAQMPPEPLARFRATAAFREALPVGVLWAEEAAVALAALAAMAWLSTRPAPAGATGGRDGALPLFAGLAVLGVLGNGVVCGVLSTLYGRYQARVLWVLPLAAALWWLSRRRPAG